MGAGGTGPFENPRPADRLAEFRAALGLPIRTDHPDSKVLDLGWLAHLPPDAAEAIGYVRRLLQSETRPVQRHYMYGELERHLYRSRRALPSALDEYDQVCRAHDQEMDSIIPALIEHYGAVTYLKTYQQASIRHERAKDYPQALWWAERGIALYGTRALQAGWVTDLIERAARCRRVLNPLPEGVWIWLTGDAERPGMETLACTRCGGLFQRTRTRGRKPNRCPACRDAGYELPDR